MLPQKFSATTTSTFALAPNPVELSPQALTESEARPPTTATSRIQPIPAKLDAVATSRSPPNPPASDAQEYCTIDLHKCFAYSGVVARPSPVSDQVKLLFSTTESKHLWSIDELHAAVVKALGAADYSSVFRAVSGLEREGTIKRIDLGDGKVHYELREEHHEHIRCDDCGRVVEVAGCVLENVSTAVTSNTGFKVTSHQLLFTGICPECDSARDA
jgi:Fur family transcriptional regulator, ferric uptake regulator